VDDHVGADGVDDPAELGIADVDDMERGTRMNVLAATGGHVVDDDNVVSGVDECIDDVRPDEAGSSGDEDAQGIHSPMVIDPGRRAGGERATVTA
jgi:hypothetical protein